MISPSQPDSYPPAPRPLSMGILWFLLTLSTAIIIGMAGAWANSLSTRESTVENRLNIVEQQYGTVVGQLQDLRDQDKVLQEKLDRLLEREGRR
jgi:hypothetical protein